MLMIMVEKYIIIDSWNHVLSKIGTEKLKQILRALLVNHLYGKKELMIGGYFIMQSCKNLVL